MTITDEFPGKNYEKMVEWSWRDESQRNFLFVYSPVVRLTDNSFAGTYIEVFSKVRLTKEVLFLPAQDIENVPADNNIESINRALVKENNEAFLDYQAALDQFDKKTLQAYNLSLAAYFSRYATSVQLYKGNKAIMSPRGE